MKWLKKKNALWLATMLFTLHYGATFLIGTGEAVSKYNSLGGGLYAVSAGVGLIAMLFVAGFYRKNPKTIWDLIGDKYETIKTRRLSIHRIIRGLSWLWMVGVVAAQILAGTGVINVVLFDASFDSSNILVLIILTIAVYFVSLFRYSTNKKGGKRADREQLFFYIMIILSTFALLITLIRVGGISTYLKAVTAFPGSVIEFARAVASDPGINYLFTVTPWIIILNIVLATVFLTMIGWDFQSQIIETEEKDVSQPRNAFWGTAIAAVALIVVAFLPTAVTHEVITRGFINPETFTTHREALAKVMEWGGGALGPLFALTLLAATFGSGGALLRVLHTTVLGVKAGYQNISKFKRWAAINAFIAFLIALISREINIIQLVVNFYGVYVGAVFVPFIAFWIEEKGIFTFSPTVIRSSILGGALVGVVLLFISFNYEIPLLFLPGMLVSFAVILLGQFVVWTKNR